MSSLQHVEHKLFDRRVAWEAIDAALARQQPRALDLIREACLIEAYFGPYASQMMQLFWYDVEATTMFAIESFEAYTHYYLLRRYLDTIQYRPVTDAEIVKLRQRDRGVAHTDEIQELVNFMLTEHVAAHFFREVAELTPEPVLRLMLQQLSTEEVVHSQFAFDLLSKRLTRDPHLKSAVLAAAQNFHHIGSYVLPQVSTAKEDNLKKIQSMNLRLEQLVGQRLSDAVAESAV